MTTKTYFIPNISCKHCVMQIKNRLIEIPGVDHVEGDPDSMEVMVDFTNPASEEQIVSALSEINYPPAE